MLLALLETMRPRQWTKNAFVFVALIFDKKIFDLPSLVNTLIAFGLLCLMSSSVYIMNDLSDIESDRQHPKKQLRPLPAGRLNPTVALAAGVLMAIGSLHDLKAQLLHDDSATYAGETFIEWKVIKETGGFAGSQRFPLSWLPVLLRRNG